MRLSGSDHANRREMARPTNRQNTETITVSVTPMIRAYLEVLTDQGLYGKNVADTAAELLRAHVRELVERDQVSRLPSGTAS